MAEILKPDLCIIGAGALGIGLAIKARQRGLDTILIDRGADEPGDGAQGALQRAAFLASAARAQAIRSAASVGLDNAAPKPNFRTIGEHAAALADAAAPRASLERLAALGIATHVGTPLFTDRQTLTVGETAIRARQFVLATGAVPAVPELPGLDQVPYFTPDSIAGNIRKLSHLVVIGGDATAFELAQAYRRLGSDVTLVPHGPLLAGFDAEMVAILLRQLREEGLAILEGAAVSAIIPRNQGTGVTLRHADGHEEALDVSHILLALGRLPDLDEAMLDKARLKRDPKDPDHLLVGPDGQTSNGRISAIGGAAGEHRAHAALRQSEVLLDRLTAGSARFDALRIARTLATEPALAQIGSGETGRPGQLVLRANLAETDAARAAGAVTGAARLIVDARGTILGAAMLGHGASEVIAALALVMDRGLGAADLVQLSLPQASPAALLVELGNQFLVQRPPTAWTRRRAAPAQAAALIRGAGGLRGSRLSL